MSTSSSEIRFFLYSHDTFGLGHIRRTISIAWGLAAAFPRASLLCMTGSPRAHSFQFPERTDYLKLPTVTKDEAGRYIPRVAGTSFHRLLAVRAQVIESAIRAYKPHLILVDHAPLGMAGELVEGLRRARRERPETRIVLGLRDITDEADLVRNAWREEGIPAALDELYDRILVYGQLSVFDVAREYGLLPSTARKLLYTGYIHRDEAAGEPLECVRKRHGLNGEPLVLVTVGGGEDGHVVVQRYLDDLAALEGKSPWRSIVVLGPFMKGGLRKAFRDAARRTPGLTVIDFTPRLREYLAGADAVLTMGGYNTLVEAVALGKRVVVVPRIAPRREQLIRAQRFGERGLVRWIDPRRAGGGEILRAVDGALASAPPAAAALDLGGIDRTVAAIRELLASEGGSD